MAWRRSFFSQPLKKLCFDNVWIDLSKTIIAVELSAFIGTLNNQSNKYVIFLINL